MCVRACVRAFVRSCVRSFVRACVSPCMRACVPACIQFNTLGQTQAFHIIEITCANLCQIK